MNVLLLAEFGIPYYEDLRAEHPYINLIEAFSDNEIMQQIDSAEIVFGYLTAAQFVKAKSLKWIQTLDAGMEGLFDTVPEIIESDVVITNARGAGAPMIGEHAIALMLALARQLPRFWDDKSAHIRDQEGA